MREENVEIVREVMEAYNRRDRAAYLLLHDPEFEFRADPNWPESGTIRGPEAVWEFVMRMFDAWEDDAFEMVEAIECGDDILAARFRRPVRGKASGVTNVLDYWCVFTLRPGRLVSQHWFASRADALAAAGLSE